MTKKNVKDKDNDEGGWQVLDTTTREKSMIRQEDMIYFNELTVLLLLLLSFLLVVLMKFVFNICFRALLNTM